jgi:8-oxo-dGTP pyrophosphatase MutT (NUDIX family)
MGQHLADPFFYSSIKNFSDAFKLLFADQSGSAIYFPNSLCQLFQLVNKSVGLSALLYFRTMNEHQNPWKIMDQVPVYENPWIELTEYQVINPSGGKGIYGKVHFRHLAVGVIPLDADWNTWLVGQYRFTLNEYSWEIPEGGGRMDEEPVEAAKRELLEETGLVAGSWTKILTMHLSNSVTDERAIIYLARDLNLQKAEPEETEELAIKKLSFDEVVRMVETGQITDAMSIAAIQQIRLMVYQGTLNK